MKDCVFCKIAKGKVKGSKVFESNNFFAMRDINQRMEGHTLIIPKRHFVTLLDIPNKLGDEMLEIMKKIVSDLMDRRLANGFNILMNNLEVAGQKVMHAHIHILPRKEGDGFSF